ncbi:MAG: hypothetical protein ABIN93_12505 [Ginsengibacter sp.]
MPAQHRGYQAATITGKEWKLNQKKKKTSAKFNLQSNQFSNEYGLGLFPLINYRVEL